MEGPLFGGSSLICRQSSIFSQNPPSREPKDHVLLRLGLGARSSLSPQMRTDRQWSS